MLTRGITSILICFLTLLCFGQEDQINGNQYYLTGIMVNNDYGSPYCGDIAFAKVYEFEILTFSDTTYTQDTIGVIITCPEIYPIRFEVGKTYKISLSDENQAKFDWLVIEEELLKKYNLPYYLWATEISEVKN